MDNVSRIIFGILLILGGLAWIGYRILVAFAGDPDEGPLGGWAYLLAGFLPVVLGAMVLIF